MKQTSTWKNVGLPISGVAALALVGAVVAAACSKNTGEVVISGDGGTAPFGPLCATDAGSYPDPSCDPWAQEFCTPGNLGACLASGKSTMLCNDASACLAMSDNSTKSTYDFRIRKLTIVAPNVLAEVQGEGASQSGGVVATGVLDPGVQLNGFCGDTVNALHGAFNWLARFDPAKSTVTTGGAPPTTDPFDAGFCFANFNTQSDGGGIQIAPATYTVTTQPAAGGGVTFSADPTQAAVVSQKLYVPIFNNGKTDPADLILLPLSHTVFQNVTISADHNCIGSFYNGAVQADCTLDPQCSEWHTDGTIGGFITLQDANNVLIPLLNNESLCAVLMTKTSCTPDGGPVVIDKTAGGVHGDYCAATGIAGAAGCQDSVWLSATFAASAATINSGAGNPLCDGTGPVASDAGPSDAPSGDAGGDAGSPTTDSGTDTGGTPTDAGADTSDSGTSALDAGTDTGPADAGTDTTPADAGTDATPADSAAG